MVAQLVANRKAKGINMPMKAGPKCFFPHGASQQDTGNNATVAGVANGTASRYVKRDFGVAGQAVGNWPRRNHVK